MTERYILLWTSSTVYRRRVEDNLLHSTFTWHWGLFIVLIAWSAFVWYSSYVIKIDIRPRPVSIFSDYVLSSYLY